MQNLYDMFCFLCIAVFHQWIPPIKQKRYQLPVQIKTMQIEWNMVAG